jgi:hypothetical protein
MILSWAYIYFSGFKGEDINSYWQVGMAISALIFGLLGMITAKQWGWFKSNVGRAVFFLALGLLLWGVGQSYWTYYLLIDPSAEVPQSYAMDIILISVIPVWIYGTYSLAKATGSKYGFRDVSGLTVAAVVILSMFLFSYFMLVVIAREGVLFSSEQSIWQSIFDLAFPLGDTILLTMSLLIFIFSWNYLGGRFKRQIVIILSSFVLLFLADFSFSFTDGNGTYYNGNFVDLLFILMVVLLGLGISMLDPRFTWKTKSNGFENPSIDPTTNNTQPENIIPIETTNDKITSQANNNYTQRDLSQMPDADSLHNRNPDFEQERQD